MNNLPVIDCDFDPSAITIDQAEQVILQSTHTVAETEIIGIRQALGRVLRANVVSTVDNPPNDNSAMDGFAIKTIDAEGITPTLSVIGQSFAGSPFIGEVQSGEAVRIMTGAKIPAGVDAVVMQEHTTFDAVKQTVTLNVGTDNVGSNKPVQQGQNIRRQGEDIKIGQTVLTAGTLLTPAHIGLLATMGVSEVEVSRKINIAVLSTGDELQSLGSTLKDGNIYDSNRYALHALLDDPRFQRLEKGVLNDDPHVIRQTFLDIADYADVVITTGGVSVGEADWIKDCVKSAGELIFWKAAIKPGRPITFGRVGNALFFGLPGNPVSVMICFEKFTRIALQKLSGQTPTCPLRLLATLTTPIRKRAGRTEFQRGVMSYDEAGRLCVASTGEQGSGILSSMTRANCLIVLDSEETHKTVGDTVTIEPFTATMVR